MYFIFMIQGQVVSENSEVNNLPFVILESLKLINNAILLMRLIKNKSTDTIIESLNEKVLIYRRALFPCTTSVILCTGMTYLCEHYVSQRCVKYTNIQ